MQINEIAAFLTQVFHFVRTNATFMQKTSSEAQFWCSESPPL